MGRTDFSDQFRKIIIRRKRTGYNLNVMRQSECLVLNPITAYNFAALFNCTPVERASDSIMALSKAIHFSWLGPELFYLLLGPPGLNLLQISSRVAWQSRDLQLSRNTLHTLCLFKLLKRDLFV